MRPSTARSAGSVGEPYPAGLHLPHPESGLRFGCSPAHAEEDTMRASQRIRITAIAAPFAAAALLAMPARSGSTGPAPERPLQALIPRAKAPIVIDGRMTEWQ